jgi:hypothetical protein
MAFIYDLSDTWNNAGISFNGIKLNATDTASAAGSKLIDLQINGGSKFTVGKTGAVIATGLIESTVGGFRFPDGTTQTTKATVNSVSGTGTVNGITLTGSVTDSGSLTLGGTLGNIANNQLTNSAITINGTSTPLGGSIAVGTVTSVAGTGTVSGLSLTGSVTTSGSLTLGGTLVLTSGQVTDGLGYTPYDATNPTGYITASALTPYLTSATAATTYQPLDGDLTAIAALAGTAGLVRKTAANTYALDSAVYITGITSSDVTTALGYTPYNATNPAGYTTNTGTVTNVTGAGTVSGLTLTGDVTTSGALTLGGTLSLTSSNVTTALGFTPYNATNPSGYLSSVSLTSNVTGTLPIANGGTGATTESGARTALGLGTAAVLNAGVAGGVATLDGSGTVPTSQLPGAVLGGLNYQGTWNASTNTPTLASSTGSKGYYYVVSTAGSTNLDGITDWKIGDWAVYDGTAWQKVDNTDAVSSVNGYTGAVVLTTSDVAQGTNLYFTQAAARDSVSAGTGISYNSTTGVITNSAPDQTVALTGAGTTTVTGTYPNFTITSNDSTVGTVTSVNLTAGTGVSVSGGPITSSGAITVTNTAPDQVVSLTGAGTTTVTGTYPNFTVTSNDSATGTVTSVGGTGTVSGLTLSGTVTTSGNLTLGGTLAVTPSNFASQTANTVLAAPNGAAGVPTFRAIVAADIPTLNQNTTGTAANVTGTVAVGNGGTGATSLASGYLVKGNGTSAASASVVYDNGTNVGIGTATPAAPLNITKDNVAFRGQLSLQTASATNLAQITFYDQSTLSAQIYQSYGADKEINIVNPLLSGIALWTANTERMRINASGDVGIGTNNPISTLDVTGSAGITTTSGGNTARIIAAASGTFFGSTTNTAVIFQANSTERMRITSAGLVGIGTSSPAATLDVNGPIYSTGAGYFSGVSALGTNLLLQSVGTAPNIQFFRAGQNNWFIGSPDASGDFYISEGASSTYRMYFKTGGNVGIGTTAALGKLQVASAGAGASEIVASNTVGVERIHLISRNTAGNSYIQSQNSTCLVGTYDNYSMQFLTNNTERMRIDTSGNVGIGTNSVAGRLHSVSTTGFVDPTLLCGNGVGTFRIVFQNGAYAGVPANKPWLHSYDDIYIGSDAVTSFNVMSGGVNTFKVDTNGNAIASGQINSKNTALFFGDGTDNSATVYATGGPVKFFANAAERMRINTSGNLLVGTTTDYDNARISIQPGSNSTAVATSWSDNVYLVNMPYDTNYSMGVRASAVTRELALIANSADGTARISFYASGNGTITERMRIDASGNVYVNKTSATTTGSGHYFTADGGAGHTRSSNPALALRRDSTDGDAAIFLREGTQVGSIGVTSSATSYNTSSDYRLKEIDGPIANSGAYIDALKPVQGSWKADGSRFIGLLAHEVQEVSETPIATGEKDGEEMQGMDYSAPELIANLIAEVQSLRARVAQLEGN